jgi:hypothetical protein
MESEMNDMSSVIVPKSDQINADDLIGGDMTITINDVKINGGQEQPVSIYFDGSSKAFRPCKSMSRVLVAAWGPDAKEYVGRSLQLYRDPTVKWGGMEVGGIRIRAMSHIDNAMTMALTATKGSRKPYTVRPLLAEVQNIAPAFTLRQAAQAIADAGTLDELKTAWSLKRMAPFREQLQGDLDARKAELTPAEDLTEGLADIDRGEAPTLESAKAEIDALTDIADVNPRVAAFDELLPEEAMMELREHAMAKIAALKAA